jgi:hypothetical protein
MAGLVPAIHVFGLWQGPKNVDARHKAGHDAKFVAVSLTPRRWRRAT